MLVKKDSHQEILNDFNNYSENLKLTVEKMNNENKINFLDITFELHYGK